MRLSSHLAALVLLAPSVLAQETAELAPVRDNTLYANDGGLSNGAGDNLFAGNNSQGATRRAVLDFDVAASVPAGSTILDATLLLFCSQTNGGAVDVGLHRLTADWGEAGSDAPGGEGSGAPAEPGDATWSDSFFGSSSWATPGGDALPAPSAVTVVAGAGSTYSWSSAQLTADVQSMLDAPGGDHGWLVRLVDEVTVSTAKRLGSRTNPNASQRPVLLLSYSPPCESGNFCSTGINSTGQAASISFSGSCVVADQDLTLEASPVPDQPGVFFYAGQALNGGTGVPFGAGRLCVGGGGPFYRLPVVLASGGVLSHDVDLSSPPIASGLILPGSTWYFQAWFRDPASSQGAFNLSDGLELSFE